MFYVVQSLKPCFCVTKSDLASARHESVFHPDWKVCRVRLRSQPLLHHSSRTPSRIFSKIYLVRSDSRTFLPSANSRMPAYKNFRAPVQDSKSKTNEKQNTWTAVFDESPSHWLIMNKRAIHALSCPCPCPYFCRHLEYLPPKGWPWPHGYQNLQPQPAAQNFTFILLQPLNLQTFQSGSEAVYSKLDRRGGKLIPP